MIRTKRKQRSFLNNTLCIRELEEKNERYGLEEKTKEKMEKRIEKVKDLYSGTTDKNCQDAEKILLRHRHPILSLSEISERGVKIMEGKANFCNLFVLVYPGMYCARKRVQSVRFICNALTKVPFTINHDALISFPASFQKHDLQNLRVKDHSKVALLCAWIENKSPSDRKVLNACKKLNVSSILWSKITQSQI